MKILVVDDSDTELSNIKGIVSDTGCIVLSATSGLEAVEIAKKEQPDIIFMDFHMPGMNGSEALEEIRRKTDYGFKAVMITAHAFDHDTGSYKTSDVSMVIKKPFKEEDK